MGSKRQSDLQLQEQIMWKINNEVYLHGLTVQVAVFNGRVEVGGTIHAPYQRLLILRAVYGTKGTTGVSTAKLFISAGRNTFSDDKRHSQSFATLF